MDIMQIIVKGDAQALKAAREAITLVLGIVQKKHKLEYEWDDCGFMDDIGGHHDSGCGWAPDGTYCGACSQSSCRDCRIWKNKQQRLKQNGDV